ncbi:hypothetical protein MASR1M31_22310 [Porphyromonadaceae bacterium]
MLNSYPILDCENEFSDEFQSKKEQVRLKAKFVYKTKSDPAHCFGFLSIYDHFKRWLTIDADAHEIVFSWIREVYENSIIYRFWVKTKRALPP